MKMITFTVKGRGRFPIDMLRYDGAYPTFGSDAGAIDGSLDDRFESYMKPWTVELTGWGLGAPTVARWESFGCKVTHINGVQQ